MGDGYGGRGVEHVVAAGDMQFKGPERAGGGDDLEAGEAALRQLPCNENSSR